MCPMCSPPVHDLQQSIDHNIKYMYFKNGLSISEEILCKVE